MSSVKLREEDYPNFYQLSEKEEFLVEERRTQYRSGKKKAFSISEFRKLVEKKFAKMIE